eukprot:6783084-Prymnesium_polylepis.2
MAYGPLGRCSWARGTCAWYPDWGTRASAARPSTDDTTQQPAHTCEICGSRTASEQARSKPMVPVYYLNHGGGHFPTSSSG